MFSIIVAFPHIEEAKYLKKVLNQNGYDDILACNSASQVISAANELDFGIVICGYRLTDMHYSELFGYLPREFQMLLVASPQKLSGCINQEIICLGMPLHSHELLNTLEMMCYEYNKELRRQKKASPKQRTPKLI